MITIRDVAKRLNLSITTVSRALDNYADVAAETRDLVVRTAGEMGYTPNRAARQLRRQRAEAIGYILPADKPRFADAFFSEFMAGLGDEVSAHNYDLLVSSAPSSSAQEQTLYRRWTQAGKIDGIILNRIRLQDWRVQYLEAQEMPFVALERSLDAANFVGIETGSQEGLLKVMAHLTGLGHTRIAYIGGPAELKIEYDRCAGYHAGLAVAGLVVDPELVVRGDLTPASGYLAAQTLLILDRRPTAIVCINDSTAVGAMRAARDGGLEVGRDIAVAGFDGTFSSAYTQPPLTTLQQPVYALARQLVEMLLARIGGRELSEKRILVGPELLVRASTTGG
jgi:LacI family transcriptional regulator